MRTFVLRTNRKASLRKYTVGAVVLLLAALLTSYVQAQTLRYLAVDYRPEFLNYLRNEVLPAFEEEYGVEVSLEAVSSWDLRSERILLSIASGVPYDVVTTGFYSPYEEGALGYLAPLTEYVAGWEYAHEVPGPIWEAVSWQDNIYVMPYNMGPRAIAYNKLRYAESGLDPERPPQSWEELITAARRVTRYDEGRVIQQGWNFSRNSAQELAWFIHQAGIPPADMETYVSNLNRPEALQALQALREFVLAAGYGVPSAGAAFINGTVVMEWHNPTSMSNALTRAPELNEVYGVFAPRRSPESDPVSLTFIDGLAILAQSQNKGLAWELIKWLTRDEVLVEAYRLAGFLTARTDMMELMSEVQQHIPLFYHMFPYAQMMKVPPPRDVSQGELRNLVNQVYANNISPEEALMRAHELWTRLLAEWKAELAAEQ